MVKLSKKQKSLAEKLDAEKIYSVDEAIKTIKEFFNRFRFFIWN